MNKQEETQETLVYNRATDCYEIRIQVPGELFRRRLIKEIEDNPAVDLTDPHTHAAFIARIGKLSAWLGRPHVKALSSTSIKQEEQKSEPPLAVGGGRGAGYWTLSRRGTTSKGAGHTTVPVGRGTPYTTFRYNVTR